MAGQEGKQRNEGHTTFAWNISTAPRRPTVFSQMLIVLIDEVRAALKKMKRHKAPGLSGLVTEMIQATGDTGTQSILDLCNGVVKEGSIREDWKSSVVLPIYKGKGDPMECGSYRGIKLLEHAMKVVERIFSAQNPAAD